MTALPFEGVDRYTLAELRCLYFEPMDQLMSVKSHSFGIKSVEPSQRRSTFLSGIKGLAAVAGHSSRGLVAVQDGAVSGTERADLMAMFDA